MSYRSKRILQSLASTKSAEQAEANVLATAKSSAEHPTAAEAIKAIKQPIVQLLYSAGRKIQQQQQHSVQRTAATIQQAAAVIRASKPSPLNTSFAETSASISAGQPSPRTTYL